MLNDADFSQFRHVYVFVGRTDLRKGVSGLSTLVKEKFHLDPYEPGNLFLFCGSSNQKIKGLLWEGLSEYSDKRGTDPWQALNISILKPRH